MNKEITVCIHQEFKANDIKDVLDELNSITLDHVMEKSQTNLDNTLLAILKLSKGDKKELINYVQCAKKDFRDVIYWASM